MAKLESYGCSISITDEIIKRVESKWAVHDTKRN